MTPMDKAPMAVVTSGVSTDSRPGRVAAARDARLLAAVDVGTVSTRLILAEVNGAGRVRPLERQAIITNLGSGVDATGALEPAAIERTRSTVAGYGTRLAELAVAGHPAERIAVTLTSAARDASNASELLDRLDALGLDPQVIPGEVEARLSLLGVTSDFPGQDVLVADIGGGSTELIEGRRTVTAGVTASGVTAPGAIIPGMTAMHAGAPDAIACGMASVSCAASPDAAPASGEAASAAGALTVGRGVSYDVGCRRVTERFFGAAEVPSAEVIAEARSFVRATLAPFFETAVQDRLDAPASLACVGGTATSLVAVANRLVPYDSDFVHLHRTPHAQVSELAQRLLAMDVRARRELPGLQPKRADVIAAGALILDELMRLGGFPEYVASESDSLFGLLACMRCALDGTASPIGWLPRTSPAAPFLEACRP